MRLVAVISCVAALWVAPVATAQRPSARSSEGTASLKRPATSSRRAEKLEKLAESRARARSSQATMRLEPEAHADEANDADHVHKLSAEEADARGQEGTARLREEPGKPKRDTLEKKRKLLEARRAASQRGGSGGRDSSGNAESKPRADKATARPSSTGAHRVGRTDTKRRPAAATPARSRPDPAASVTAEKRKKQAERRDRVQRVVEAQRKSR